MVYLHLPTLAYTHAHTKRGVGGKQTLFMDISTFFFFFLIYNQIIEGLPKTTKSWRHPLGKPPARSPMTLVKQQVVSDEGECMLLFFIFSNR